MLDLTLGQRPGKENDPPFKAVLLAASRPTKRGEWGVIHAPGRCPWAVLYQAFSLLKPIFFNVPRQNQCHFKYVKGHCFRFISDKTICS